ncbi:MAG: hypothetical protein D6704_09845 [Nitrospirae bacterium]|nr:MAG: hypothetical protein D6704_09845 [Nitrospirota bacterium]
MYSYCAYGLGIHSVLPLPELISPLGRVEPEVIVQTGTVEEAKGMPDDCIEWGWATPDDIYLYWRDVCALRVTGGKTLIVHALPGSQDAQIRFLILNRGLPAILHQKGFLVLHGSVVAINQKAVVFLGESQQGKSTLAAFLHQRGHWLMADDLAAMRTELAPPLVYPGFPEMRLWPDTLKSLGEMPEEWASVPHRLDKRTRTLSTGFSTSILPLQKIFVLAEGQAPQISVLSPREAFLSLMQHSVAAGLLGPSNTSATHLHQCANLIRNVPICRFERPRSLEALPDFARLVELDLAGVSR